MINNVSCLSELDTLFSKYDHLFNKTTNIADEETFFKFIKEVYVLDAETEEEKAKIKYPMKGLH